MAKSPIIIQNGSTYVKAMIAGDPESLIKVPTPPGAIQSGDIKDIESVGAIWIESIKTLGADHGVILSMGSKNTSNDQARAAHRLFINCNIPFIYIGNDAVLSLYATGRTTGLVVDCGRYDSTVSCIIDGKIVTEKRMDGLGGLLVTQTIQENLAMCPIRINLELGAVNELKERFSQCLPGDENEKQNALLNLSFISSNDILKELCLGNEVLFADKTGLDSHCVEVIKKCQPKTQTELLNNIVLCGGTTLTHGFESRLFYDIYNRMDDGVVDQIVNIAPANIGELQIVGGSVLAAAPIFEKLPECHRVTNSQDGRELSTLVDLFHERDDVDKRVISADDIAAGYSAVMARTPSPVKQADPYDVHNFHNYDSDALNDAIAAASGVSTDRRR